MFPRNFTCDICGTETFGTNLCADCKETVTFNSGATCPVCGRKTVRPEICLECKDTLPKYKRGVSAFVYDGGGIALIAKFKNGNGYLKEYFADLLTEKLKDFDEFDCITYVPLTKKSIKKRGYNQSKILAKALSERLNKPVICGAIEKVKNTAAQKGLSHQERRENLKGAFKVVNSAEFIEKRVLIIDDILTTGATADEISSTVLGAGAKTVYFATVAAVEYKILKDNH